MARRLGSARRLVSARREKALRTDRTMPAGEFKNIDHLELYAHQGTGAGIVDLRRLILYLNLQLQGLHNILPFIDT